MNQGARDANVESSRMAASNKQDQILDELRIMNNLLRQIANNTAPAGTVARHIREARVSGEIT